MNSSQRNSARPVSEAMRATVFTIAGCILMALCGCAGQERLRAGIYEALRTRAILTRESLDAAPPQASMSYEQYRAERQKLLPPTAPASH
jgi:hypothetical protein